MIQILSKNCFSDIREFEIDKSKTIGKGSFGEVRLAVHKGTNKIYAIKIINLSNVEREYELRLIQREIHLHSALDHPHVIKLWDTILDASVVYLVMEYAEGGNLFHHQNTKTKFSQAQTFKFFYQITKAVGYMHSRDILHRDIKPQNILLDKSNNVLLADFGWSAKGIHEQRSTFCGTYEYMAPEMISKSTYDYKVDVWSLGVLLYEMLHGNAPFTGETLPEVRKKVERGEYGMSSMLSPEVKSLMRDILQLSPASRPSIETILAHPWCRKMSGQINSIVKKQPIKNSSSVGLVISKIITDNQRKEAKPKTLHRKVQSAINMFGCDDPYKSDFNFDQASTQEQRRKPKKSKGLKTQASELTPKMGYQRGQSPGFSTKQNLNYISKLKEAKLTKHSKHTHSRLLTEIGQRLKMNSPTHSKAVSRLAHDRKQIKKRPKVRDFID